MRLRGVCMVDSGADREIRAEERNKEGAVDEDDSL